MRRSVRIIALCLGFLLLPQWTFAQGQLGALTGSIFDPSGAIIPETEVTITNMDSGINWTVKGSSAGYYRVPVPPGRYQVEARKEGFKASLAKNVVVSVAQVVTIDLTLQVGSATQSITVTTEAPLLTPSTAEVSTSITAQEFDTLPVIISDGGRQLDTFIWESLPGATPDWANGVSINGGQDSSHQILIDGVTLGRYDNNSGLGEFSPGTEAIGEFKVQMSNYSAEYGDSGGGIANFAIKSGTNQFHGSVFEFNMNPMFNANGFMNNASPGSEKSSQRENNFGGSIGGPIRKNKTFFFFNYEGDRKSTFAFTGQTTVPSTGMLKGNFSDFLTASSGGVLGANEGPTVVGQDALGRDVAKWAIYDPTTTRLVPAGAVDEVTGLTNNSGADAVIRDPYPNNQIPAGELSTATSTLLSLFPTPPSDNLFLNIPHYGGTCCPVLRRDAYTVKIDEVINNKQKLTGSFTEAVRHRWMRNNQNSTWAPWPSQPLTSTKIQSVGGPQLRIMHSWTINDHSVNVLSLGYNRFGNSNNNTPDAKYTAAMAIPGIPDSCFPPMTFTDTDAVKFLPGVGVGCANRDPVESYDYQDTFSTTRGKHSLKFGGQFLRYRSNDFEPGSLSGTFSFNNIETGLPGFYKQTGHAFASFLLGAAHGGSKSVYNTEPGYRAGLFAFFAQDDWRATSKLTLSLGVRWEIPMPKTEAWNRMSGFDATATDTLPSGATLPGAIVWLGSCSTCIHRSSFQDWNFKNLAPRFGLAYQINKNMVFRGGYGITYQPPIQNGWGPMNFMGFNSSVARFRQGGKVNAANPVLYLSDWAGGPAPGPLGLPEFTGTLPNMDPTGMNGYGPDYLPANSLAMPYVQNWSGGFQYQLPHEVLLEADYVGSKGTRLFNKNFGNGFNQANGKYMAMGDLLGDSFGDDVSAGLLQPYGITQLPYPTFEDDNYSDSVAAGLAPFPQYSGLINDQSAMGKSSYHSLQFTARKNAVHGLTFIAAYTLSKTISDSDSVMYNPTYIQDFYNRKLEKSIASFDYPQVLKLTWIYSLPLGRGQRWLNSTGIVDRLVSGWQLTAIQRYGSGSPLQIGSSDVSSAITPTVRADTVPGVTPTVPLHGLDTVNGTPYLNNAAFADPPSSPNNAWALRPGTAGPYLPNVRGPAHQIEDFGLIKNTRIRERFTLQLRADFANVFNRTGRGDPDPSYNDGSFGMIFNCMNGPRVVQMGMHLNF
ncbi:MAG: TonB-dependent receptor [Terriglobia bacterium]